VTRAARWPVLIWLALLIAALAVIARTRIDADFSAFLPAAPTPQQQLLVDQLQNGVVARMLLVGIEGGSNEMRGAASRHLAATLRARAEFSAVDNGEPIAAEAERKYLFDNRYLLSPAVAAGRFDADGLRGAIGDTIDELASPAGLMLKNLIGRDPTAELLQILEQLEPGGGPRQQDGIWVAPSGQRALLLLQTAAAGSDTDAQQAAAILVETAFAAVRQDLGADGGALQLRMTGPGVFAVHARDTIRSEAEQLAALSLLCIVCFLWLIYRSWRLLALGLLPVATAIAIGIAAVSLRFGSVHGITLGFGTTLVGEAVDYAIYFFIQAHNRSLADWRQHFWPTIRLGVIISICGFATLLFSGFPGLAQLGLYSIAGLIAAAATTRYVLPHLVGAQTQGAVAVALGLRLRNLLASRRRHWRWPLLVLALGCAVTIVQNRATLWDETLTGLSPIAAADLQLDTELRDELGAPDVRYLIAVRALDRETALQHAEQIGAALQPLVERGLIKGFESPARYLPSVATQRARQQALPERPQLEADLRTALADLPLSYHSLTDFLVDIDAARQRPPLQRADLQGTRFALAVDSLLQQRADRWQVLMPLQSLPERDIPAAAVRAALQALPLDDVWLIDITGESQALYANYFREALHLSLYGLLAICVVFALHLRSPRALGNVVAPLAIAVLLVMAALVLVGQRFNLLHLIGLFLIVAVGSNYALFFVRGTPQPQTLASLAIANITTVAGFGLLAFSSVPVLHAIGSTVGPGVVLALICAALWSRPQAIAGEDKT
jgi:predicted exporter